MKIFHHEKQALVQKLKDCELRIIGFKYINLWEDDDIFITFSINDEIGKRVKFKCEFNNVEELNDFIDLLNCSYIVATHTNNKVKFEKGSGGIDLDKLFVSVNGVVLDKIKIKSLYYTEVIRNLNKKLYYAKQNFIDAIKEVKKTYEKITSLELDRDHIKGIVSEVKKTTSQKDIKNLFKVYEIHTRYYNESYRIDFNKIVSCLQLGKSNELEEEIRNILTAIESSNFKFDYYDIGLQPIEDGLELIKFISILEKMTQKINEFNNIIKEYEKSIKKEEEDLYELFEKARNEVEKNHIEMAVNILNSINITDSKAPSILNTGISTLTASTPAWQLHKKVWESLTKRDNPLFKEIQRQQQENLTTEEREALIVYKSSLYRPINNIIEILRDNNITLEEAKNNEQIYKKIVELLSQQHDNYTKTIDPKNFVVDKKYIIDEIFDRYNHFIDKEIYIKYVLESIPLIESATKKIETTEDIVVYRSVRSNSTLDEIPNHFMSTTIDMEVTNIFIKDTKRKINSMNHAKIIKIIIPKGSPVIAYTDDLFLGIGKGEVFGEPQQEILIDPKNFTFNKKEYETSLDDEVDFVTYIAQPKLSKTQEPQNIR